MEVESTEFGEKPGVPTGVQVPEYFMTETLLKFAPSRYDTNGIPLVSMASEMSVAKPTEKPEGLPTADQLLPINFIMLVLLEYAES